MRLAACALALLALAPLALAQTAPVAKTFALVDVDRGGDALGVTLRNVAGGAERVVASLLEGSTLLAPEQALGDWPRDEARALTFDLAGADPDEATLRLHYRFGDEERQESITFRLPPRPEDAGGARVDVVDVAREGPRDVRVTVRSTGAREAGPVTVALEDEAGARIGDPLQRTLPRLAPGAEASATFRVPPGTTAARVALAYQNETTTTAVRLPEPEGSRARWVELRAAYLVDDEAVVELSAPEPTGSVVVGLEDMAGVLLGAPLSREVDRLDAAPVRLSFRVPPGTTEVKVVVRDADRTERIPVRLEEAEGNASRFTLRADLPSREAEPGASVGFDLSLSNEGAEALVSLSAEGLPEGYGVRFSVDGSVVPEVLVPKGATRRVVATVQVPESAGRANATGLPFTVVAAEDGARVATLDLSLSVRGRGRLELQGQNWFASATPGGTTEVTVTLRNAGNAPLQDVAMEASVPAGWSVAFSPATLDRLDAGEARPVTLRIDAPPDAGAGRYVLDVSAANDDASARPRSLSVEVEGQQGSALPWVLAAGVAVALGTALIVKLRRR